jgi:conjugal transfer pilin signal peptidase TrbI
VIAQRLRVLQEQFRQKWALLTLVVLAIWLMGYTFNKGFGFYLDPSVNRCLPEVFYVGYPSDSLIEKGSLVSFEGKGEAMAGLFAGKRVVKQIAGLPGDVVSIQGETILINGVPLPNANPEILQKMRERGIARKVYEGVIPANHVYVVGTLPRSFDSRYWGLLNASYIDKKAIGVF